MNQARLARVLRNMERDGLTQIVISSTASVYYLTGYWVEPMERMLALYIRADGTCRLFANALFALEPQEGLELVLHQDSDEPTAALAAALLPGTLGVDKAWPSKFLIALLAARPDVTPVLGSAPVDDARKYKDADEISAMRRASQINDQVVEAAIAAVKAGAVESELAAYVEGLYRQHGADRSGEGQLVCFGPNGADPHHAPNGTVLRDGDSVVLDIFIPIRRYWCDMTRTVFFRSVSDEGRRVYETVKAANLAAEAVIRPGVPMKDIDRAARKLIEDAGLRPLLHPPAGPRLRPGLPRAAGQQRLQPRRRRTGDGLLRGAGHLPAGQAGRAHRGSGSGHRGRLRGAQPRLQGAARGGLNTKLPRHCRGSFTSVQELDAAADNAVADIDAEGGVHDPLPKMLVVGKLGLQPGRKLRHLLRRAAVGHG